MIRDIIVQISELLFYAMDGNMLMNSPWIFVWVIIGSVILSSPMTFPIWLNKVHLLKYSHIVFAVLMFPVFLFMMGPPIAQAQMMQECETVKLLVDTDKVMNYTITEQQCRYKDNYYGKFGEWTLGGRYK